MPVWKSAPDHVTADRCPYASLVHDSAGRIVKFPVRTARSSWIRFRCAVRLYWRVVDLGQNLRSAHALHCFDREVDKCAHETNSPRHRGVLLRRFQAAHTGARAQALQGLLSSVPRSTSGRGQGGTPIERILTGIRRPRRSDRAHRRNAGFSDLGAPAAPDEHADERGVGARRGLERIARARPGRASVSFRAGVGRIDEDRRQSILRRAARCWPTPTRGGRSAAHDLIVASNGGVYFTDPGLTVQAGRGTRDAAGKPLGTAAAAGRLLHSTRRARDPGSNDRMIRPNGIQLSRDEKTLYASDSNGSDIIAWDIRPDASCATGAPSAR